MIMSVNKFLHQVTRRINKKYCIYASMSTITYNVSIIYSQVFILLLSVTTILII